MKIKLFLLPILFFCFSCKQEQKQKPDQSLQKDKVQFLNYSQFKSEIKSDKYNYADKNAKEKSDYLYNLISKDLYLYWKNTPWDFNGTTRNPGTGKIACGYFITNTLSDLGFKIARIKLAQAPSSIMINELCVDVAHFSKFSQLEEYVHKQPDRSVFIVGLDFHTGYILKEESGIYFLHSNYIDQAGVMKELASKSTALLSSKSYMVGNMTSNTKLINNWIGK